jgi:hypothetical protein
LCSCPLGFKCCIFFVCVAVSWMMIYASKLLNKESKEFWLGWHYRFNISANC